MQKSNYHSSETLSTDLPSTSSRLRLWTGTHVVTIFLGWLADPLLLKIRSPLISSPSQFLERICPLELWWMALNWRSRDAAWKKKLNLSCEIFVNSRVFRNNTGERSALYILLRMHHRLAHIKYSYCKQWKTKGWFPRKTIPTILLKYVFVRTYSGWIYYAGILQIF